MSERVPAADPSDAIYEKYIFSSARAVYILVVSPFESEPLVEVVEKAYRAGIPTIITDRRVNTDCYTTFIGADNQKIGELAGQFAASNLPKGGKILEIWGLPGSSPAMERHRGFVSSLAKRKDIVCDSVHGNWLYDDTRKTLLAYDSLNNIDIIYAHNDIMAIAAREVMQEKKISRPIMVMGVDAVTNTGLKALQEGQIDVSFLYPTGGEQVIRTAIQILRGESVPKEIPLYTTTVNKNAAQTLLLQNHQRRNYQKRIMEQRDKSNQLLSKYEFLQNSLWIISLLTVCSAISLIYVYLMNNKIIRINRELLTRNEKEEEQNRKLISLNAEIKEVTAQKLRLFTDVSHEVRTPLTLILSPLEQLQSKTEGTAYENDIKLIYRNASRLLRVINQVLDFQRLESGTDEKWHFVPVNLTTFLQDIKGYFDGMASIRHITYNFVCPEEKCEAFIDRDKMEKVIVNLLSNAFKYTSSGGTISLTVQEYESSVLIIVSDTGVGINEEDADKIFDRFYQVDSVDNQKGTGIGLALAKGIIEAHKGKISVKSTAGKGSSFIVELPLGDRHIDDSQKIVTPNIDSSCISELRMYATQMSIDDDTEDEGVINSCLKEEKNKILIVEDNEELRELLVRLFSKVYLVYEAQDGEEGLGKTKEIQPDVVLSDVMMPKMSGIEMCRKIKTNFETSHIPVILLTAQTAEEHTLQGLKMGADDYVTKPFNVKHLFMRCNNLVNSRKLLQQKFARQIDDNVDVVATNSVDYQFMEQCVSCVEQNLDNPDFDVNMFAQLMNLGRTKLFLKVKGITGLTPNDFILNVRLKKAQMLLKQSEAKTVSEIAYEVGFNSPSYFIKRFRELFGVTPSQFQRSK